MPPKVLDLWPPMVPNCYLSCECVEVIKLTLYDGVSNRLFCCEYCDMNQVSCALLTE